MFYLIKNTTGDHQVDVPLDAIFNFLKLIHKTISNYSYSDKGLTVQPYLGAAQVGRVPHSLICPCGSAGRFACATPSFLIPPAKLYHISSCLRWLSLHLYNMDNYYGNSMIGIQIH